MSTTEKLFVQIFDKKRQIIEHLKQQKLQYEQRLASKLLIQGISPPPWLLSSDFPSSSSDPTAVDKEELILGLLRPQPGPIASYTSGPCFLYDKPDQECDKCASSNGCEQDISTPLHHANDPEDDIGIIPPPCVDVMADRHHYTPAPPEDQNYTRISDTDPMSEQSLVKIQRSISQQKALKPAPNEGVSDPECDKCVSGNGCRENGSISLHDANGSENQFSTVSLPCVDVTGKTPSYAPFSSEDQDHASITDVDPMSAQSPVKSQRFRTQEKALEPAPDVGMPDQECEKFTCSDGSRQDNSISLHGVDDSEDGIGIIPQPNVGAIMGTLIYAPMSPEDQSDSRVSDLNHKPDQSLVKIQRSRSRQKALEIRSSAKGSCKRSFEIHRDLGIPSGSKTSRDDDQVDSLSSSVEMLRPPSLPTNICGKDGVQIGNCLDKDENSDACDFSLVSFAKNEAEENQIGDKSKTEKTSSVYADRVQRSRSCGKDSMCISSGKKICRYDEHCAGLKKSHQLVQSPVFSGDICFKNEGGIRATIVRSEAMVEIGDHRSSADSDASVKPQQLDFDEATESLLVDIPNVMETRSIDKLRQRTADIDGGSWPCYKRRKIDNQNFDKSASPSLGLKPINASRQDIINTSARGDKYDSATCENVEFSHYFDSKLSKSEIPANEADRQLKDLLNKGVESTPDKESYISSPTNLIHTFDSDVKSVNSGNLAEQTDLRCCVTGMDADLASAKYSSINFSCHHPDAMISDCEIVPDSTQPWISSLDGKVQGASGNGGVGPSSRYSTISLSSDGMLFDCTTLNEKMDQTASCVLSRESEILHQEARDKFKVSLASPLIECMNVTEADQAMPEFEVFGEQEFGDECTYKEIAILRNIMNQASSPDTIRSASSSTPVSPYPASCKFYLNPSLYSSVPNGLLEKIDLGSNLLPKESVLQGKSQSDPFSFPRIQSGWDVRRPLLSPVGKGFECVASKSGGSDKMGSGNPELSCFTIKEDPESGEEDLNEDAEASLMETYSSKKSSPIRKSLSKDLNEVGEVSVAETDSSKKSSSVREPLCVITQQNENTLHPNRMVERSNSASVSTEIGVSETHKVDCKGNVMEHRKSGRTVRGKENKGLSVGCNSHRKQSKTLSSRFSKPKLSGRSSTRSRGQSISEKEPKRNNIVSNLKSFVPLVQQKQAAAAAPVKRDVKVKALEAAEAAKRLAEKKENERKQKKEALKLERAKLEQDNLKQMEHARKQKEEAKKKREADNAARKRQREEEERKGKESKRARLEQARFQQKQANEKIHAQREESRCGMEEEKAQRRDHKTKTQNEADTQNEGSISKRPVKDLAPEWDDRTGAGDAFPTLNDHKISTESSDIETVGSIIIPESSTPNFDKNDKSSNQRSREPSYDISPYQCSDDEDDTEDEIPNNKFIPTWASKKSIALALPSQQLLDPDTIFPPGSFCGLEEVLMPRRLSQK